jgi:RNA polymerase sigma factor (sigma-70 family)
MSEHLVNYQSRWAACAAGNVVARDALLQDNLSLVHYVAKQLSRSMSADADPDEMINIGTLGLMSALESFDESRGLAFSTYAVPRIRGAILDELRRQDHVPRSIRRKTRDIAQARETLMCTLGRAPRDTEVARLLDIDVETLWRWQADMERTVQVSLSSTEGDRDEAGPSPIEYLRATTESAGRDRRRPAQCNPPAQGPAAHRVVALLLRRAECSRDRRRARDQRVPRLTDSLQGTVRASQHHESCASVGVMQ